MPGFNEQAFESKLNALNASQQSIQTLSLWLIHHRKHYKMIIQIWFRELKKQVKASRRVAFMYLANDVIQNSKKKGSEFTKEFHSILKPSFQHIAKEIDQATLASLDRIIKVWDERSVYDKASIKSFSQALHSNDSSIGSAKENGGSSSAANASTAGLNRNPSIKPPIRKRELEDAKDSNTRKKTATNSVDAGWMTPIPSQYSDTDNLPHVDLSKYEPVEPDKLIKSLKELENCASADETTRQKISNFPPELFNMNLMEKALTPDSAVQLFDMVDKAQGVLASYNTRLKQEMEDRKQLSVMLSYFIEGQKRALAEAEKCQQEFITKLKQVQLVGEELKSHLQKLPDLSQLPTVNPLPSALDLFNPQQ